MSPTTSRERSLMPRSFFSRLAQLEIFISGFLMSWESPREISPSWT